MFKKIGRKNLFILNEKIIYINVSRKKNEFFKKINWAAQKLIIGASRSKIFW